MGKVKKLEVHVDYPTPEEDAAITKAAMEDPDTWPDIRQLRVWDLRLAARKCAACFWG